jgi:hypothetical protein
MELVNSALIIDGGGEKGKDGCELLAVSYEHARLSDAVRLLNLLPMLPV